MKTATRKTTAVIAAVLAAAAVFLCAHVPAGAEEGAAAQDEWTVMFYFCGADLESKYGYASANMEEMLTAMYPYNLKPLYNLKINEEFSELSMLRDIGKVNVLLETGGASGWHLTAGDTAISTQNLQRWRLNYYPAAGEEWGPDGFELLDTIPLRNMSDPETLADFIRWSVRSYPAKKYALVLWGHGGGAKTGIFVDELYEGDVMNLSELRQALADGGTCLDTLVMDACLMANLETMWAVKDSARWLVASEETVPGKGTAVGGWLQALFNHPSLDGEWLSRCICDKTDEKYANDDDDMSRSLLTWSVIDLSRAEEMMHAADNVFRMLGDMLQEAPQVAKAFCRIIAKTEEYGDRQNMRDFGDLIYSTESSSFAEPEILDEAIKALSDTVVYVSRGHGRSGARGLSFCYPAGYTREELDVYAANCPSAPYLAYLDAISPQWNAPDRVYEETKRLPEIDTIEELQITIEKVLSEDGMPALDFGMTANNLNDLYYRLYRLDESTGDILRLGMTDCGVDPTGTNILCRPADILHWPAIDGELCCIDLVRYTGNLRLYDIPVQINTDNAVLRCGRSISRYGGNKLAEDVYEIYGVWDGYDENIEAANRNVKQLAIMAGRRYRMLYPIEGAGENGKGSYAFGPDKTMLRALSVEEVPLPPGTYFLEYEIKDHFFRSLRLDRIEMHWDGEKMSFPDDFVWEGPVEIQWE